MTDPLTTKRNQKLLRLLIERYIHDGIPVASKILANDPSIKISPATIRNIMADLEATGFLSSPHTSSGRVPTAKGYRFFVDDLLDAKSISDTDISTFVTQLKEYTDTKELVSAASSLLSGITKFASIIMLPRSNVAILKQVEFLLLSDNRILVVLVLNQNEVQNRIIYSERCYTCSELQKAANYINTHFVGLELNTIRKKILDAMRHDRCDLDNIFELIMSTSEVAFAANREESDGCVISGERHLLDFAEETDITKLRALFDAFTQKRSILHLLDQCINADGIKIYIGEESGYEVFGDCSLVTAPYLVNDKVIGVLGVIGPTRMQYERVISAVDMTAKLLSTVLG